VSNDFTLFKGADLAPILGLHVELARDRWRGGCAGCDAQVAVIGERAGPHAARVSCVECGRHRGWLPRAVVYGLLQYAERYGRPTTTIKDLEAFSLDKDDTASLGDVAVPLPSAPTTQTKIGKSMKVSEEFPSKWLKASDLQDREAKAVIQTVVKEKVGKDSDLEMVVYFNRPVNGVNKPLILNKTNANFLADAYGDDTGDWESKPLILKPVTIEFQGKPTPAIRFRLPTARDNPKSPPAATTDDDTPF
jgi:hypothetical protein